MASLNISGTKFDFDIGNLSESPCRRCLNRQLLPDCTANCEVLKRVQTLLACSVSSVVNISPEEDFTVSISK